MSSGLTLTYFDIRGLAELPRLCLVASGIEFTDDRIPFVRKEDGSFERGDWEKRKASTPYGQVPVLTVDGTPIAQSGAIIRYIGNKGGLLGTNDVERALIDAGFEQLRDVRTQFQAAKADATKAADFWAKQFPEGLALLNKNAGSKGFFVGSKLSVTDIAIYYFLWSMATENADAVAAVLKDNANINAINEAVKSNEKIAAHVAARKPTIF